jgi:hypothetical protein
MPIWLQSIRSKDSIFSIPSTFRPAWRQSNFSEKERIPGHWRGATHGLRLLRQSDSFVLDNPTLRSSVGRKG